MLPALRTRLRSISSKNKSLQDILQTSKEAKEVLSILPTTGGVHNTQLILLVNQGERVDPKDRFIRRIHFYSRLDLADIMSGVIIESKDLPSIINELNLKGYDFTEDDLEIVENKLQAKTTSIGYVGVCPVELASGFEITCEGALPKTNEVWISGVYNLIIDDELIATGTKEELAPIALQHGISFVDYVPNHYDV